MTMPSVMRICFYTHFPWQCLTAWMERRKEVLVSFEQAERFLASGRGK